MGAPAVSATRTDSGALRAGAGLLFGAGLAAGADAATATFHDGTDNTGPVIAKLSAAANTSAAPLSIPGGITFATGLYVAVTGTSPRVNAYV